MNTFTSYVFFYLWEPALKDESLSCISGVYVSPKFLQNLAIVYFALCQINHDTVLPHASSMYPILPLPKEYFHRFGVWQESEKLNGWYEYVGNCKLFNDDNFGDRMKN